MDDHHRRRAAAPEQWRQGYLDTTPALTSTTPTTAHREGPSTLSGVVAVPPPSSVSTHEPLSPSSRLLRNIEETSDLLRTFRQLKQRGASRGELAALHVRVRSLKEAQLREAATVGVGSSGAQSLTSLPQSSSHTARHADPVDGSTPVVHSRVDAHGSLAAAASYHAEPRPAHGSSRHSHGAAQGSILSSTPEHRLRHLSGGAGGSSGSSTAVVRAPSSPSPAPPLHSIVFAVVLAESHTRRELAHKWERRLLRLWATFREARVAIALKPAVPSAMPSSTAAMGATRVSPAHHETPHTFLPTAVNLVPPAIVSKPLATSHASTLGMPSTLPAVPPVPTVALPPSTTSSTTAAVRVGEPEAEAEQQEDLAELAAAAAAAERQRAAADEEQRRRAQEEAEEEEARRTEQREKETAARVRAEQQAAAAVARAAEEERKNAEASEARARHAVEAAELNEREQLHNAQRQSHMAVVAAATAAAEAKRVLAAQAAAELAEAREGLCRAEVDARARVEGEENNAWAALVHHADDASDAAHAAAAQRQAKEARDRAAAAEAEKRRREAEAEAEEEAAAVANERRLFQQRAQTVHLLESMSSSLMCEWVRGSAVQAAIACADAEKKAAAAEAAVAQALAAKECEAARVAVHQEEAVARRAVETCEHDARQQLVNAAQASHTSALQTTTARLEAEAEEEAAAARAKALQEAAAALADAVQAVGDAEAAARAGVQRVEEDDRWLLGEEAKASRVAAEAGEASRLQTEAAARAEAAREAAERQRSTEKSEADQRSAVATAERDAYQSLMEAAAASSVAALAATTARLDAAAAAAAQERQRHVEALSAASRSLVATWVRDAAVAAAARFEAAQEASDSAADANSEHLSSVESSLQEAGGDATDEENKSVVAAAAEAGAQEEQAKSQTSAHEADEETRRVKSEHCNFVSDVADSMLSQWLTEAAEQVCAKVEADHLAAQVQQHQLQQEREREEDQEAAARHELERGEAAARSALKTQEMQSAAEARVATESRYAAADAEEAKASLPATLSAGDGAPHKLQEGEHGEQEEDRSAADALSTAAPTTPSPSSASSSSSLAASAHALGASFAAGTPQLQPPSPTALVGVVDHLLGSVLHDAAQEAALTNTTALTRKVSLPVQDAGGAAVTSRDFSPSSDSLHSLASSPPTAPLHTSPHPSTTTAVGDSDPLDSSDSQLVPALVISVSPPPRAAAPSEVAEGAAASRDVVVSPATTPPPPVPPQPQLHFLQPDALQTLAANPGPSFSSPLRSLSMISSTGEDDDESPTLQAAAQGVRQPLHLTPPPNRYLSPLLATTEGVAHLAGGERGVYGEESSLFPESSRADSLSTPLPPTEDALATSSRHNSAAEVEMSASAVGEELKPLNLDAPHNFAAATATPSSLSLETPKGAATAAGGAVGFPGVAALEATSARIIHALIHDAVRLLPSTRLVTSSPQKDIDSVNGAFFSSPERRHSPSLSPDRLERVRPLSPSHPHHSTEAVMDHGDAPTSTTPATTSTTSSVGNGNPHSGASSSSSSSEEGERQAEKRRAMGDRGRGFTKSDGQETLPLSPASSPSPTALVGAPAVAPGAGGGGPGADLASLTTLVTAVATPTDFVAQLRQHEAARRAAAHQQNRYLTTREVAATAAGFLTSEAAAQQVAELGPTETLGARAVALVLGVGLVRRVTVANRRARRRVEAAAAAAEGNANAATAPSAAPASDTPTTATTAAAPAPGMRVMSPRDSAEAAFPTSAEAAAAAADDERSDEGDENVAAPASPSLGHRHFGGGFPSNSATAAAAGKEEELEVDPYASAEGGLSPSVMSPSTSFPKATTTASVLPSLLPPPPPPANSPTTPFPTSGAAGATTTTTTTGTAAPRDCLPLDWAAGLRAVAERVARDLMDYATRRVLLGQGEGQANQDHLRTPAAVLQDALAAVHLPTLFTQELRPRDVARLTSYYLELALNGSRERMDPHYAPTALGEHNIFGRRSSGDVDDERGAAEGGTGSSFPRSPGMVNRGAAGSLTKVAGSPPSIFSPSVSSPHLHARSDTFLTAATAMHVRRAGLMQMVLEQCIANVLNDVVGDTVGWLGTAVLQPKDTTTALAP